jgi:hypothetical protein
MGAARPGRIFWPFLIGVLLVQAAWIVALPTFRGPDEFDHVYRADAVAHGHVLPGPEATNGRGELTPVRRSIVDAAGPMCSGYKYTGHDNCYPVQRLGHGAVSVASGAGRYNPAYYAVVGTLGRFADGAAVDYVLRAATALICAALLAWAAVIWGRRRRSLWPALGLMTALSPALLYSTAVAAPNGLTYAGAVLVWAAGIDLARDLPGPTRRSSVAALVTGAGVVCNTHTTGPMWLLVIAVAVVQLRPLGVWWAFFTRTRAGAVAATLTAVGGVLGGAWTVLSGANTAGAKDIPGAAIHLVDLFVNEVAWLLQSIAGFPLRNDAAPVVVYGIWLVPFALLVGLAVRQRGRTLRATGIVAGCAIAIPTVLTLAAFHTAGYSWQGRYALPITVGLLLLPAHRADEDRRLGARSYAALCLAMAASSGISIWSVAHKESMALVVPAAAHVDGGASMVGLLGTAGALLMAVAAARQPVRGLVPHTEGAAGRAVLQEVS